MVLKGDSVVYKKELGDFNSKTVAPIASCGKWLTAALVMQFVEEGKISLDDKVAKYLPIFEKYNKNYITIRHCLSHYTGIKDETTVGKIIGARKYKTLEDEVDAFAAREIRTNPGEDFSYSNIGINIAARVLEVVSKKKFEQLIKQRLLTPLGMRKTSFTESEMMRATNPSAGAVSNADDYMHFLQMLLNNGIYQGKRILSEASVKELRKVHSKPEQMKSVPKAAEGFDYALGAWVIEKKGTLGTTLACPGLFGSWPMVDWCRGYAYLVITKSLLGEEKAELHLDIKKIIDGIYPSTCK
ncbi:beta-lactamase family protein [Nostoc ellipsosporum NOK]|nr:beta-lactamase family protein [Nostoc ellipsosporum NOK]